MLRSRFAWDDERFGESKNSKNGFETAAPHLTVGNAIKTCRCGLRRSLRGSERPLQEFSSGEAHPHQNRDSTLKGMAR